MHWILGIDLGGTELKCGAFTPEGELLAKWIGPTRDGELEDGRPAFVAEALKALARLTGDLGAPPQHIGVAAPGLVARDGSSIAFMPGRLQGLENLDWQRALDQPQPVPVLNDAHAALLGEVWCGAARGRRDVVLITLGTGVGGAIVSDGRLLRGHLGRAGHLGHLTVDHHGPPTITGTPGGIEVAIGNATVAARTGGRFTMSRDLAAAAQAGDAFAQSVWAESVHALAAHLAGVICALDPELIVIGGGIAELDDFLFLPLRSHLDTMEWRPQGHRVEIRKATLGSWAGTYGAAWNAISAPTAYQ
ncbi:MAG: ROK family protein [Verrucomicrobiales bacterium]